MKRWWLWAALGAALLLVSSGQTWASGTFHDPVIGTTLVEVSGTQAGATLTAGALLAGAAVLAGLVGSRPVRAVAAVCLAGGALLAGLPALTGLLRPQDAVAAVAADRPGATGLTVQVTDAAPTLWPWVGLIGALLVLAGALLCAMHWLRSPAGPRATGSDSARRVASRPARPTDAWDDLSQGRDPTLGD